MKWRTSGVTACVFALGLGVMSVPALAQDAPTVQAVAAQRSAAQWMQLWNKAAVSISYGGHLLMSGGARELRTARIWHAVQGRQHIERLDMLYGPPRSRFRSNDAVVHYDHDRKHVHIRTFMPPFAGMVPGMAPLHAHEYQQMTRYYDAKYHGVERVANQMTDVVTLQPRDKLRYAYKIWSDRTTGLLLRWQMLGQLTNPETLLREVAFSNVQIGVPMYQYAALETAMLATKGYQVRVSEMRPTSLAQYGWKWRGALPGYFVTSCYDREGGVSPERGRDTQFPGRVAQCTLGDGMASISVFFGTQSPPRPPSRGAHAPVRAGMHVRTQAYPGGHSVTALGEVPEAALQVVLDNLQRLP